jgi:excisionase family DNA binding protein
MEEKPETAATKWYSIKEAAQYLNVGEPTIYRWMRERRITYRKVGDSTRFIKEDLDAVCEVFRSAKDAEKVETVCPACHHTDVLEGHVQSTGLNYFRLQETKFWTLRSADIGTRALMCAHCGLILWFGDKAKLAALRSEPPSAPPQPPQPPPQSPPQQPENGASEAGEQPVLG